MTTRRNMLATIGAMVWVTISAAGCASRHSKVVTEWACELDDASETVADLRVQLARYRDGTIDELRQAYAPMGDALASVRTTAASSTFAPKVVDHGRFDAVSACSEADCARLRSIEPWLASEWDSLGERLQEDALFIDEGQRIQAAIAQRLRKAFATDEILVGTHAGLTRTARVVRAWAQELDAELAILAAGAGTRLETIAANGDVDDNLAGHASRVEALLRLGLGVDALVADELAMCAKPLTASLSASDSAERQLRLGLVTLALSFLDAVEAFRAVDERRWMSWRPRSDAARVWELLERYERMALRVRNVTVLLSVQA